MEENFASILNNPLADQDIYWLSTRGWSYGNVFTTYSMFSLRRDNYGIYQQGQLLYSQSNTIVDMSNYDQAFPYRPVITIPKSSCNLFEGGLHGEDYHIEPSDKTLKGTSREIGSYEQMTPTNYTRTGESIDYVPNPPETSELQGEQYRGDYLELLYRRGDSRDTLSWRIWGEDNENIYLISENPTNTKLGLDGTERGQQYTEFNTPSTAVDSMDWASDIYYGTTEYQEAVTRSLRVEDLEYITENEVLHQGEYGTAPYTLSAKGQKIPYAWGYLGISKLIQNSSKKMICEYSRETNTAFTTVTEINPIITAMNYTFKPNDEGLINPKYYKLIVRDPENTGDPMWYWLASRYISGENGTDGAKLYYGLLNIQGNRLSTGQLYTSAGESSSVAGCGIRPVVIIPKTSCTISMGGTNGETYHIQPKG